MIRAKIIKDKEGFIRGFTITGHAGFAKYGEDIVCAGVSAIAYTILGSLAKLTGIKSYTEKEGFLECKIPPDIEDDLRPRVKLILDILVIGLKQIEKEYSSFVVIEEKEVPV